MFKIALNAGHYLKTPGKRCDKKFDSNTTREWVLNSRICEFVEEYLKEYSSYKLLRIDDETGESDVSVDERARSANKFGADIYISVHHNAGINGGSGGGIMAFTYINVGDETKRLQKLLYENIVEETGLKGNRSEPLSVANFAECRLTKMPAVLLECGFMDSSTDTPIILTEDFAVKAAKGIVKAIVEFGNLKKKAASEKTQKEIYLVQVGAYENKDNAENIAKKLKAAGYPAIIKKQTQE